jgi:hypothetical protein
VLHGNVIEVDAFETADVDCRHGIALGVDALRVGMDPARSRERTAVDLDASRSTEDPLPS